MYSKIDYSLLRDSDLNANELKDRYLKLNDWNFTIKMESIASNNQDFTKILLSIKKYQFVEDMSLC